MRQQYLKAMGITSWRLRNTEQQPQAERELAAAMMQALGMDEEQLRMFVTSIPYSLAEILKNPILKAEVWKIFTTRGMKKL